MACMGVVAELPPEAWLPLTPLTSCHPNDLGGAEGVEAVHECDADVDFGGLAVGVAGSDASAEGLDAAHLHFDAAAGVVSCPSLPEGSAIVPGGAQSFVSGNSSWAVCSPRPTILADRDDRDRIAREDRCMTRSCVVGIIGRHGADVFAHGDLLQQH